MRNRRRLSAGHSGIIAREGWVFVFLFGSVAALFLFLRVFAVGIPALLLAFFTLYFFRNPERCPPEGDALIISPADGKVIEVSDIGDNEFTNGPAKKISIFMSIFNVHVNRVPLPGKVREVRYRPGRFMVAFKEKASSDNEKNAVIFETSKNLTVAVVQIAGFVARRIVCYLSKGDSARGGQRLGLIRFGSRVDLYLPRNSSVDVAAGERVRAGETIIGRIG